MKNSVLEERLERLTSIIERMTPPIPAIPAIPQIPAIPALPTYTGDHDLLVEINTKVKGLEESVKKLTEREDTHVTKADFAERILSTDKIHADHEIRIRGNEVSIARILTYGSAVVFVLGLAEFIFLKVFK